MEFLTEPKPLQRSRKPFSVEAQTEDRETRSAGPLAVYLHWPYCQSKCPYCDFNSYARRTISEEEYVAAAIAELRFYEFETRRREVSSIFFGGGTPSLMGPGSVSALLDEIAVLWPISDCCEVTLEANPSSVEAARFAGYRAAGVNRVSVGIQSFEDAQLRFLGRLHTAEDAAGALQVAGKHFDRVSFDLIYARPGQSPAEWRRELCKALALARGHLSLYQLTIEPETAFFELHKQGKLKVPQAELASDLYEVTQELCEKAGLPAYEVSNHAAPGQESRHNLAYWRYGDYLGIGPGAHGRVSVAGEKYATAALKKPDVWHARVMKHGNGCEDRMCLDPKEQAEEMMLMGLRLREGLDLERLRRITGYSLAAREVTALQGDGHLEREDSRIYVSKQGRLVLNAIINALAATLEQTGVNGGEDKPL